MTDIAKYRNRNAPADVIKNWLRSRSTIEFLGLWEKLNNPNFKLVEFDQFRNDAGSNSELIKQKIPAEKRLEQLNRIAIDQMRILIANKSIKKMELK